MSSSPSDHSRSASRHVPRTNETTAEDVPGAGTPEGGTLGVGTLMTLSVLVLGATIMLLNETSLSVALPAIMESFAIPATTAQWMTTGFMLTMAVVIPTTGFLMERLSTRQVFVASTSLFLVGTVVAALAPVFPVLLAGRIVQAAGTALMMPLLMTVTMILVPPQRRGTAMGVITVVIAVAPALGPTMGGFILNSLSWHYNFWVMVPLLLVVFIFGLIKLPNVGQSRSVSLDLLSVFLSVVGFGGTIYGLSSVNDMLSGQGSGAILITVVGVVALVMFVLRQRALARENRALMDLRPCGVRNYSLSLALLVLSFGLMLGIVTVLPIYLQTSLGVSAAVTGLVVMPGGLLLGLSSPFIGRVYDGVGPRPLLMPGAVLLAASLGAFATVDEGTALWVIIACHVTMYLGMGLLMTPLMTTALGSISDELYGHGSAIMSTFEQIGGAIGTALLVVFLSSGTEAAVNNGQDLAAATAYGAHKAFLFAGALALVGCALAPFIRRVDNSTRQGGGVHS